MGNKGLPLKKVMRSELREENFSKFIVEYGAAVALGFLIIFNAIFTPNFWNISTFF